MMCKGSHDNHRSFYKYEWLQAQRDHYDRLKEAEAVEYGMILLALLDADIEELNFGISALQNTYRPVLTIRR